MHTPVVLPEVGADARQPITLSVWFADTGDYVYEGDRLVEVLVAGATFDVPSPATGQLAEILVLPDDVLRTGQVLGFVEAEPADEGDTDNSVE